MNSLLDEPLYSAVSYYQVYSLLANRSNKISFSATNCAFFSFHWQIIWVVLSKNFSHFNTFTFFFMKARLSFITILITNLFWRLESFFFSNPSNFVFYFGLFHPTVHAHFIHRSLSTTINDLLYNQVHLFASVEIRDQWNAAIFIGGLLCFSTSPSLAGAFFSSNERILLFFRLYFLSETKKAGKSYIRLLSDFWQASFIRWQCAPRLITKWKVYAFILKRLLKHG